MGKTFDNMDGPRILTKSLYIGNLPFSNISEEEIRAEFAKVGRIKEMRFRKGYAFVEYENNEEDGNAAIEKYHDILDFGGRKVRVEWSRGGAGGRRSRSRSRSYRRSRSKSRSRSRSHNDRKRGR